MSIPGVAEKPSKGCWAVPKGCRGLNPEEAEDTAFAREMFFVVDQERT